MTPLSTQVYPRPEGGGETSPPPWGAGRGRTKTLRTPVNGTGREAARVLQARRNGAEDGQQDRKHPPPPLHAAHRRDTDVIPTSYRRPKTANFAP